MVAHELLGGSQWALIWSRVHLGCLCVCLGLYPILYASAAITESSVSIAQYFIWFIVPYSSTVYPVELSVTMEMFHICTKCSIFASNTVVTSHRGYRILEMWLV